ncbi:MAG: hypothetical protein ACOZDD_13465 [Bacteroidota bacterium]
MARIIAMLYNLYWRPPCNARRQLRIIAMRYNLYTRDSGLRSDV